MLRRLQLRAWLAAMDVIAACGGYGTRAYYYALDQAARNVDW